MTELDVIVIGAGHAGLAISCLLKNLHLEHIVFEKKRIGESWRSQRWDSFRLNSPNEMNLMPGNANNFIDKEGFCTAPEFVSFLQSYAEYYQLPVQENSRVLSVDCLPGSKEFQVNVLQNDHLQDFFCRQVVVASGGQNIKVFPSFAGKLSSNIFQLHAADYKNPSQLPEGGVLVVGCAQSGIQIAEDLVQSGKKVYISTCKVGRVPRIYRGKDIFHWLFPIGMFDTFTSEIPDPALLKVRQPQISGVGEKGHTISLQFLAKLGAVILGKVSDYDSGTLYFQPDAADNIRFADLVSEQTKKMIDSYILKMNMMAPLPEIDPADLPDPNCTAASAITRLKLSDHNITSVIWATGFKGDFGFLHLPVFDQEGNPNYRDGVAVVDGLYFLGLPWLRRRKSAVVAGIIDDAEYIAGKIEAYHQSLSSVSF